MTRREIAYNKRLKELTKAVGKLDDKAVKRVLGILEEARLEVAARVASTPWEAHAITAHKEAIEAAIARFRQQYATAQSEALANMWNAGIDLVDSPLQFAGIGTAMPELSLTTLEVMQGYSADLIGGLAADAVKRVNSSLILGITGQKSLQDVMKEIGRSLTEPGVFGTIATRAETIARTEMARVCSASRQARMEQAADDGTNPPMTWYKRWLHSGKAKGRSHHEALDGMVVPMNEDFPGGIPYPHAPGLDASEVINCGCTHTLYSPDWEQLDGEWEPIRSDTRAIYD